MLNAANFLRSKRLLSYQSINIIPAYLEHHYSIIGSCVFFKKIVFAMFMFLSEYYTYILLSNFFITVCTYHTVRLISYL